MHKISRCSRFGSMALLVALAGLGMTEMLRPTPAHAQGTCEQLWYQRNQIYADKGFCFKTERARRAFGAGCFPPYGRLSATERRTVASIQREEDELGCPR
jgi:hypothetical protein